MFQSEITVVISQFAKIKDLSPDTILVLISSFSSPEIDLLCKKFNKLTLLEKPLSIEEIRKILRGTDRFI